MKSGDITTVGVQVRRPRPRPRYRVLFLAVAACAALSTPTRSQVRDFVPVTDAVLQHPDAGDWINWRRTSDGWGYSPLATITRRNVGRLRLVWSGTSPTGS